MVNFKEFFKDVKRGFNKFWFLLWSDDSFKGWIFSIIFLFIFIKFLFFPGLGLITGTSLPMAIVESCSMYHQEKFFFDFDSWWELENLKYATFGISKQDFDLFKSGLRKGDIIFIVKARPDKIKLGDVIIFDAGQKNPLIHRVVDINQVNGKYVFSTFGDNNDQQLSVEKEISEDQLVGKPIVIIGPYLGWAKLVFFEAQRADYEKGFCK